MSHTATVISGRAHCSCGWVDTLRLSPVGAQLRADIHERTQNGLPRPWQPRHPNQRHQLPRRK